MLISRAKLRILGPFRGCHAGQVPVQTNPGSVSLLVQNAKTTWLLVLYSHPSSMVKNPNFSMQDKSQLEQSGSVSLLDQNAKTTWLLVLLSHPSSMIKNPNFSMQDKLQLEQSRSPCWSKTQRRPDFRFFIHILHQWLKIQIFPCRISHSWNIPGSVSLLVQNVKTTWLLILHSHPSSIWLKTHIFHAG